MSKRVVVLVWVRNDDYFSARYSLIEGIKSLFDANGIVIPYNQLDVHIISESGGKK